MPYEHVTYQLVQSCTLGKLTEVNQCDMMRRVQGWTKILRTPAVDGTVVNSRDFAF